MKLKLIKKERASLVSKKFLKNFLLFVEKALEEKKILSPTDKTLIIVFVSSQEMRKLNKKFLKKDCVTDVLSFFPIEEDSIGELALCGEKIRLQSKEHGLSIEEETAYLILHGLLHLLGYHHERGGEPARKMYQIQDEMFEDWLLGQKNSK